jgi:hypothetical protein
VEAVKIKRQGNSGVIQSANNNKQVTYSALKKPKRLLIIFNENLASIAENHEAGQALSRETSSVNADKFVLYSHQIIVNDEWKNGVFIKKLQRGKTLSEKMLNAFMNGFIYNYCSILCIRGKCEKITSEKITEAFNQLEKCDFVFGPDENNELCLIGMKQFRFEIFMNPGWNAGWTGRQLIDELKGQISEWDGNICEISILSDSNDMAA